MLALALVALATLPPPPAFYDPWPVCFVAGGDVFGPDADAIIDYAVRILPRADRNGIRFEIGARWGQVSPSGQVIDRETAERRLMRLREALRARHVPDREIKTIAFEATDRSSVRHPDMLGDCAELGQARPDGL